MSLGNYLSEWKLPLPTFQNIKAKPLQLELARQKVESLLGNIQPKPPSKADLDEIYKVIEGHFSSNESLVGLSSRYLRRAPWILFTHPKDNPGMLGKNRNFLEYYFEWVNAQQTAKSGALLLFAFLREYPTWFPTFKIWCKKIYEHLKMSPSARIRLVRKRCDQFYLLEEKGPQWFGELLLKDERGPNSILDEAGLTGQLGIRGFILSSYKAILKLVGERLSTGNAQDEMLKKLFSFSSFERKDKLYLRFDSASKDIAEALLLPYAENKGYSGHQKDIQNFLISSMGDPRINKSRWIGIAQRAKGVIYGWLVEATLDIFFTILDKTADEIWKYRRAFWDSYYKKGYISEAWVILGKNAAVIARALDNKKVSHGYLKGAASDQSVLLLKIGDLTVAEWSHSGKCRIWRNNVSNQNKIPNFYEIKKYYHAPALRREADFEQIHHSSEYGRWQSKIEAFIRQQTNIRVFHSEYMPKGY